MDHRSSAGKALLTAGVVTGLCLVLASRPDPGNARAQSTSAPRAYMPLALRDGDVRRLAPPATAAPSATPRRSITPTASPTPETTPGASATAAASPSPTAEDCGSVPTFADGLAPTLVVHVATTGNDEAGDGSAENPFATLTRAARSAQPGTGIRLHEGTYGGGHYLESLRGKAAAPVWLGGAPGESRPVIQGGGEGLHLVRPAYLVVHDMEVRGSRNNGLNCDDGGDYGDPTAAHHVVFRDLTVHDIGADGNQDCLKLSGLNHFVVVGSAFARCGGGSSGSGIDMVGAHHGLIARNAFDQHAGNAVQVKGGSADVEIRWNRMRNAGQRAVNMGGSTGFAYFRPPLDQQSPNAEARNIRLVANVIEGGVTPFAFVGCVSCLAANNTIIDPERWLMRILQETSSRDGYRFEPVRDGRVINNVFYFERGRLAADVNVGPNTAAETFAFSHNLWFAHDSPGRSRPNLPVAESDGVVGRDPGLGPDRAIESESPAAGAGVTVSGVRGDMAGRCYRRPPSIGAYEVPWRGPSAERGTGAEWLGRLWTELHPH